MSPLWNKERLRIFLKPGGLTIARVTGLLRAQVDHKATLTTADLHWQASLDALDGWLGNHHPAALEFVLSAHYTRFFMLPWDASLTTNEARLALAAALFERQYAPDAAGTFTFQLANPAFGKPQLVVAAEQTLISALQQCAQRHARPLLNVTPLLDNVWNRFEKQFQSAGTLAIAEENRLLLARFERRHIVDIQLRPVDRHTLQQQLALAAGNTADSNPLYLFAPQLDPASITTGGIRRLTLHSATGFSPLSDIDQAFGLCGAL